MIVHPNINCFFNSSNEVLVLPPHNTEIFNAGFMTCDVVMVIHWGGGLEVLFEPLSKSSWGGNTIKSLLMTPKDKDHISKKSGIIYRFKCNRVECDDEYIGESSRTFGQCYHWPTMQLPRVQTSEGCNTDL